MQRGEKRPNERLVRVCLLVMKRNEETRKQMLQRKVAQQRNYEVRNCEITKCPKHQTEIPRIREIG